MAEARISQDEFMCSVCLDLLKDPVATSCGHSFCKICITGFWDQEDQMRVYSCPQCRQTFRPRPALAKNTILAEMVEKLKKIKLPTDCYAGAGDVQCDVCTGRKHKAVKSCLVCLSSYCQNHLEQHESLFKGKRHNLTEATGRLQEMICPKHDKILEVFCRTDQKCICLLCMMDEHKNHDTVSAAAQRTEKQHQLKEMQRSFQQRIQQREKDLQQLREAVESHKRSAQTAVEDSERIFTELICSIERSRSEAKQRIRDQEKTAVSRAEGRLKRLEQEINDLRRREAELEQLSHTGVGHRCTNEGGDLELDGAGERRRRRSTHTQTRNTLGDQGAQETVPDVMVAVLFHTGQVCQGGYCGSLEVGWDRGCRFLGPRSVPQGHSLPSLRGILVDHHGVGSPRSRVPRMLCRLPG
ncbi:E3 ubiquitin/ISG15 ligase TRIM25-like [Megalobrama amblycephala]|uniref:E3 ubiquitin/ISG15 ligase TRIM25-like n=1 Tax=Megalobrama amblycephala TaxID=75352 RepID=UPI002014135B|nr:E3 ubiquitin/ISG15 ligase TRIM25-like [Megalobrama amblycephala]